MSVLNRRKRNETMMGETMMGETMMCEMMTDETIVDQIIDEIENHDQNLLDDENREVDHDEVTDLRHLHE
jgi:hypothetical protein